MADDYRREITACFEAGDRLGAHRWAKGWTAAVAARARWSRGSSTSATRKRKRSVDPAPSYSGRWLAGSGSVKRPPPLWELVHEVIER